MYTIHTLKYAITRERKEKRNEIFLISGREGERDELISRDEMQNHTVSEMLKFTES